MSQTAVPELVGPVPLVKIDDPLGGGRYVLTIRALLTLQSAKHENQDLLDRQKLRFVLREVGDTCPESNKRRCLVQTSSHVSFLLSVLIFVSL